MVTQVEYDLTKLAAMTQLALLVQICLRLDRHFPAAQGELADEETERELRALFRQWIDELNELGFADQATQLEEVIG